MHENLDDVVSRDPRALHTWANHAQYNSRSQANPDREPHVHPRQPHHRKELQRDWSVFLGGGPIGPWSSPAKFSFDINAAPDCTKDFVVFPTNNADFTGSTNGLPTLIAFNNLYTGCMEGLNITSGLPSGVLNSFTIPFTGSLLDISGIVIDNVSSLAQASSIYFVGNGFAYKLTQSALQ